MKKLLFLLVLFVLCVGIWFIAWFVPSAWLSSPEANAPSQRIELTSSTTAVLVADVLMSKGLISSAVGYRVYAFIDASANRPKSGAYAVKPGMSYRALARMFALGPERDETDVTVIEGWTMDEIGKMLAAEKGVPPDAWQRTVGNVQKAVPFDATLREDFPFLNALPTTSTLEGYLFPDTYRIWKDQLPEGLVRKQLKEFESHVASLQSGATSLGRSLRDVVILASIVEREVSKSADRRIVAGIFWNRIRSGMPLQSDATVNYVTKGGRARPTFKDLDVESAYNTYAHKGLPPAPISNPSWDALEAAAFPATTDYKYFLTDDTGKTYYARTFEEHIKNRKKAFGE